MNLKSKIGIVVVSYHNPMMTARFVKEELSKLTIPYELVIVNNDSTEEECVVLARECGVPDSVVVCSKENLGYAKGNNLGVECLKGRGSYSYYLFSNDDIEINNPEIIEVLCDTMSSHTDTVCIGPRVISLDGRDQSPHTKYISPLRKIGWKLMPFFRKNRRDGKKKQTLTVPQSAQFAYWVSGAFMLVSADEFEKVGGFDPRTFLYYEEVILAERFLRIGKKVLFEPSVSVIHYEGNSTKSTPSKAKMQIEKNSSLLYYKEYKKENSFLLNLYNRICF